jgi:hypothetical protein
VLIYRKLHAGKLIRRAGYLIATPQTSKLYCTGTAEGGAAETRPRRAANIGWKALHTEQAVSYDRSRSFAAILDHQPVPENSLRCDRSKPSSCGKPSNVEAAGTATSRRQHLQVRREVQQEEVRCLRPTPAVHSRLLPAAVSAVFPLSALLTLCIAVVWQ